MLSPRLDGLRTRTHFRRELSSAASSAIQSPKTACIRSAPSHPFPRLHVGTLIARVFVRLCLISPVLSTVSGAPKFSNLSPNSRSRLHLPAGLCFVALYPFRFVPVRPTQRPPCPSSSSGKSASISSLSTSRLTTCPRGLAWHTEEATLRQKFEEFGPVEEAVRPPPPLLRSLSTDTPNPPHRKQRSPANPNSNRSLSRTETLAAAVASASSATLRKAMRRTPSRP